MNSEERRETAYLDILRWLAIGAVVMLHVVSGIVDVMPDQMAQGQRDVYGAIKNLMRPGVPIFLMISGALFLDSNKDAGLGRVLKRYLPRILLALFFFGVPYAVIELVAVEGGIFLGDGATGLFIDAFRQYVGSYVVLVRVGEDLPSDALHQARGEAWGKAFSGIYAGFGLSILQPVSVD